MATKTRKAKAKAFIPCRLMSLPESKLIKAAERAVTINPANAPMLAMGTKGAVAEALECIADDALAIAVLTTKYWGTNGVKLTVTFTENTPPELKAKIVAYANKWGQRANVEFRAIDTANWSNGDVRISRGQGGYYSYLGTDIRSIARNRQTMNLQGFTLNTPTSEYERVVVHEFGHTLGFPHEHARQAIVARLDPAKTIAYFRQTQGWSEQEVRAQVLTPLSEASIMATPADEDSCMTYQLPASITRDGRPIRGGATANESDLAFCGRIYPKPDVPPPPTPPPGGFRYILESASEIKMTRQP